MKRKSEISHMGVYKRLMESTLLGKLGAGAFGVGARGLLLGSAAVSIAAAGASIV